MPKPGWQLELMSGAYERTYKTSHAEVGDGVRQVVFTGELPDSWFDELVFRAVVTDRFRAGTKVFVPLVQTCAQGQAAWVDVPAAGQDAHRLEYPAPSVTVVSAPLHTH